MSDRNVSVHDILTYFHSLENPFQSLFILSLLFDITCINSLPQDWGRTSELSANSISVIKGWPLKGEPFDKELGISIFISPWQWLHLFIFMF